ncbi:MAG: preprotein translocase subunit SecG [Sulfurimonas sp. RIFCSPLOWO2_12_36_12]|uniref:preprotein translocase subunit SecG n=1 Tax=Sulfurimonas sp. RIFCSPLOWO2_12_36_12 TaxID=1802253 RepID=UPI0008CC5430|nr:preprotein translocase subunit SecG [Sulfurimonas sp. RIFCSPLOWO2_12_36_12]OHE00610.1 MAG: preprotein translocase subunit SecG [Sulfurimonas sp. RIFCSPLOWO2_12_36_12]
MTTSFLLIVQIVLVVMLVIAVLLQKSSSIGLGAYSGSNESVFGAKGPASFLAKTTFIIGFLFVVNTITLGYMYASASAESVVDNAVETTNVVAPSSIAPVMPAEPTMAVTTENNSTITDNNSTTQK